MFSITAINALINESRNKQQYCQYNQYRLKPVVYQGHIFWININDGMSIYCEKEAISIIEKEIGLNSPFRIKVIPQDFVEIHNAIHYFEFIVQKFPSYSSKAAEFGKKLSFPVAMTIATICHIHAQKLSDFKETTIAIKTQQYGINVLRNWERCNDLNGLSKEKKEEYKSMMANSLYQMAIYHAYLSNLEKTLVYCKDALTFTDLPRIKKLRHDTLKHINKSLS